MATQLDKHKTPETAVTIPSEGRQLLEEYSKIAPAEVIKHVTGVVNITP